MRDEHPLPSSTGELAERLGALHKARGKVKKARKRKKKERRRTLTADEREKVRRKTGGHCHLCGGTMDENADGELPRERRPVYDHIVPWASGGEDSLDNFLAAHGLCNGSRWFYSPEEFQWILRMGVWARKQMEDRTKIGKQMLAPFLKNERAVRKRRKLRLQD